MHVTLANTYQFHYTIGAHPIVPERVACIPLRNYSTPEANCRCPKMSKIKEIAAEIAEALELDDKVVDLKPWRLAQRSEVEPGEAPFVSCSLEECDAVSVYSEYYDGQLKKRYIKIGSDEPERIVHHAQFTESEAQQIAEILRKYDFKGGVTLSKSRKTYNIWRRSPSKTMSLSYSTGNHEGDAEAAIFKRCGDWVYFDGEWMHEDAL